MCCAHSQIHPQFVNYGRIVFVFSEMFYIMKFDYITDAGKVIKFNIFNSQLDKIAHVGVFSMNHQ